jgi:hypothetical protein
MAIFGVATCGSGALYTLTTADLLSRTPPNIVAAASGFLISAQSVMLVILGPLVGAAVDHFHGYAEVSIALGAWVVPGSIAWLVWNPGRSGGETALAGVATEGA